MPLKHHLSRPFVSLTRPFFKLLLANSIFLHHRPNPATILPKHPPPISHAAAVVLPSHTLIFHVESYLLRSSSTFPYFMLVAVEAGSLLRVLLLLLLYPVLLFMGNEAGVRMMTTVCFFGVRKKSFRVGRAVLPKFLMEDVGEEGFEELRKAGRRVGVSSMPRVMVESFLKEYLEVEVVIGREMKEFCGFYTGFMEEEGEEKVAINGGEVLGFVSRGQDLLHRVFSSCKEIHRVSEAEKSRWLLLPREKYPKPLIFHDGRLAFRPTPTATLAMFMWLPLGITLSVCRTAISIFLPTRFSVAICALIGMVSRIVTTPTGQIRPLIHNVETHLNRRSKKPAMTSGHLYICNHRTLLDPIYISASLNKPVIAVVYSLSRVSEFISPIKTARLTRNKDEDRKKMEMLLKEGDLVVCPEGTTCREPYLLRFSPLFAELADEITPVALKVETTMFYGTTTCGFKWLDSFYFAMNPQPKYEIQFLERISVVSGDPRETANRVQSEIGRCLGFRCTALTRKHKYQMLAGNDGVVHF